MKISVLGAGSWGTAIAIHLNRLGHQITLWMRDKNQFEEIVSTRHNKKYLDVDIPQEISITTDLKEAVTNSEIVVIAVPSHAVREISEKLKEVVDKNFIVVNLAKGIETSTLKRMSEVIKEYLSNDV
ncbi:MAG: Glycerol-3-phosphate dehydrogenase [NAD(P)+], partial [Caldanaerobacter subterraneus]